MAWRYQEDKSNHNKIIFAEIDINFNDDAIS